MQNSTIFSWPNYSSRRPRPAFTAPEDVGPETLRTLRLLRPLIGGAVLTSALLGASSQMGWKSQETWRSW
jgi:hypothetical protein